jgi:hypothetical protein
MIKRSMIIAGALICTMATTGFAQNQGFFLNDWQPKTITVTDYNDVPKPTATVNSTITVNVADTITKVSKYLFGNNSNLWIGQLGSEPTIVNHLTNLKPNIIRAPGGSISDVYFFNALLDQPPADAADSLLDASGVKTKAGYWYGKNANSWTQSLDNYYSLLQQTGSTGIITVNYAYARYGRSINPVAAAAHLAADWVRYDNGRTKFWEIGNENFGNWEASYRIDVTKNQDGQPAIITGALYGQHVKVFVDSMKAAAQQIGATIYIGAQLLEHSPASWEDATSQTWNSGVIPQVNGKADFYIVHSYYTPYNTNSNAADILATATANTQTMMNYVTQNIPANGGTLKPIAQTEFNIFSIGSMQQVSHINGMHAAIAVSEMMKMKFGECTRWDLGNAWENGNDHGLFNVGDEPGGIPKWNPRPAFYHMFYLQKYCGDNLVNSAVTGSLDVLSYATMFSSGQAGISIFNKGTTAQTVKVNFQNFTTGDRYYWYTLSGGTDNGEFSRQVIVNGNLPTNASGGPLTYASIKPNSSVGNNDIKITVPARSAVYMLVEKGNTVTGVIDIDPAGKLIQLLNNPSSNGSFTLKLNGFTGADKFSMNIIDASGKIIAAEKFNWSSIVHFDKSLAAGVYLIKIKTQKGITTRKLIVQ